MANPFLSCKAAAGKRPQLCLTSTRRMNNMKPAASRLLNALAIAVFATMVLLAPTTASAQEARGTITGKVVDPTKAVVAGATVKVTNVAMGTTFTLRTNE